ncbi:MAG: ATP synthase F1 subunit gamma [Candidatus Roizmanbacteria bacterium]
MNIRAVRKKTKSVKNVKKITKAMQMVSAVKMKKSVVEETEGRPYRTSLFQLLQSVASKIDISHSPLLQSPPQNSSKDLVIYISANKGLCGAFHMNLLRYAVKNINLKETEFVTLGTKGAQLISHFDRDIISDYSSGHPLSQVTAIFDQVISLFTAGSYRSIKLLYTQYISATKSEVVMDQLLPFESKNANDETSAVSEVEYLIEPSPASLVGPLLRSIVEEKIRGAVISSAAVEHSMRMMAMKNATDNATDVIYSLTLIGNKLRQTKITGELLDMITAKESVEQN